MYNEGIYLKILLVGGGGGFFTMQLLCGHKYTLYLTHLR
jgi:hypothetical protein